MGVMPGSLSIPKVAAGINNEFEKLSNAKELVKQHYIPKILTSLLEIPCWILDIQKQSRGGAARR